MKMRKTKSILVIVILPYIIMGCTTVITRDYGSRQFSTPLVMQNMTQNRAIALVYGYCLVQAKARISDDTTGEVSQRSGNDLRVDSSGLSFTRYTLGPFVPTHRSYGHYTTTYGYHTVNPVMVQVNFADVKRIEYDNWDNRINLYDGNGHRLFSFHHVKSKCYPHSSSFPCGKDKKEELMAALLILCPNVP